MKGLTPPERDDIRGLESIGLVYPDVSPHAGRIAEAYLAYQQRRAVGVAPVGLIGDVVTSLKRAFRSRSKRAGLDWIGMILARYKLAFCPLCGGPGVVAIDHHLPEIAYPEYAVFSQNLLPSCSTCNPKRGAKNAQGRRTTYHPFFDHDVLSRPIIAAIIRPPYEAPEFALRKILTGDPLTRWRTRHHVRVNVDVGAFRNWAAAEWVDILAKIAKRHSALEPFAHDLRETLSAEVRSGNGNSWRCALYRGLLRNNDAMLWMVSNPLNLSPLSDDDLGL